MLIGQLLYKYVEFIIPLQQHLQEAVAACLGEDVYVQPNALAGLSSSRATRGRVGVRHAMCLARFVRAAARDSSVLRSS